MTSIRAAAALVALLAAATAGCAGSSGGFDWVDDAPADPVAHYRVTSCTQTSDGSPVVLDDPMDYYLTETESGQELYQFHREMGARLTNSFRQDDGLHYVFYMETDSGRVGHELVVPDDRTLAVEHRVYLGTAYEIYEEEADGTLRVRGEPTGRCVVEPVVTAAP